MIDFDRSKAFAYLGRFSPSIQAAFADLRKATYAYGPLDHHTCELITLVGFLLIENEGGFKAHARSEIADGVNPEALRHAVLVLLGAIAPFSRVTMGLRWLDDVIAEKSADPKT